MAIAADSVTPERLLFSSQAGKPCPIGVLRDIVCRPVTLVLISFLRGRGFKAQSGTGKCNRGAKVFCCEAGDWNLATEGCRWSKCGDSCKSTEKELATTHDSCTIFNPSKSYCCPKDTSLNDCTWRGTPMDCADAKCKPDEVAIATLMIIKATASQAAHGAGRGLIAASVQNLHHSR